MAIVNGCTVHRFIIEVEYDLSIIIHNPENTIGLISPQGRRPKLTAFGTAVPCRLDHAEVYASPRP